MIDWFETLAATGALSDAAAAELHHQGFVVLPGLVSSAELARLTEAYTSAMASASGPDVRIGSTSTRVSDFVNRGAEFDAVYMLPALLDACCRVVKRPFKLSSLHALTVRPHTPAQEIHVDVRHDSKDWPLLGFILMVDEFRSNNGATRFVSGSHRTSAIPAASISDPGVGADEQVLARGTAGSLLIFNGSTWHGHAANISDNPRRSLQGAFIPGDGQAATNFAARMQPETRATRWPVTDGCLERCEVVEVPGIQVEDVSSWQLQLKYSYVVRGVTYHSTRYAFGYGDGRDDKKHRMVADALKRSLTLSVRYNPAHPSEAVISTEIQTNVTTLGYSTLVIAAISALIAVAVR